jgi:hypothetical protein
MLETSLLRSMGGRVDPVIRNERRFAGPASFLGIEEEVEAAFEMCSDLHPSARWSGLEATSHVGTGPGDPCSH